MARRMWRMRDELRRMVSGWIMRANLPRDVLEVTETATWMD